MHIRKFIGLALVAAISFHLAACGGGSAAVSTSPAATPFGISLEESPNASQWTEQYSGIRLDVAVPIFDPNIPDNSDDYEKLGVWPELRRTEAVRFAVALKDEIRETRVFGNVRTTPDVAVSADLYVQGEIIKSNGEDIEIKVAVHDISGKRWMKRTYKHRVKGYHWNNIRQQGKDPYQPVFAKAARDIAKLLKKKSSEELTALRAISEIQFASAFAHENFAHHLEVKNNKVRLVSLPSMDDPMLVRTRSLRVIDGTFEDKMQTHYVDFVTKTNDSYASWQQHSMEAAKAKRDADSKATMQALGGLLLLVGAASAADNSSDSALTNAAIAGAAIGGVMMLQKSFTSSAEGKYHRDNLMELGSSLNLEVAPQVVQVEEETLTLQGDVKSQYRQWREFLKAMYEAEATPVVQL